MKNLHPVQRTSPPLVRDVIEIILSYLYEFPSPTRKPCHRFAHCALISRAWRVPVQTLLFREVGISQMWHLLSLEEGLTRRTEHARRLAHTVRVLWVRITDIASPSNVDPGQLARCMRLFPLLYELRIELVEVRNLDDITLRSLQKTPAIHALRLYRPMWSTKSYMHFGFTNVHLQLLKVAHWQLEYFVMEGNFDYCIPPQSLRPPRHRFKEVILHLPHSPNAIYATTSQLLKWVLKNSSDSIEGIGLKYYTPVVHRWMPQLKWFASMSGLHCDIKMPNAREILWFVLPQRRMADIAEVLDRSKCGIAHVGFHDDGKEIKEDCWKSLAPILPATIKHVTYLHLHNTRFQDPSRAERLRGTIQRVLGPGIHVSVYMSQLVFSHYSLASLRPLIPREEYPHVPSIRDYGEMTRALTLSKGRVASCPDPLHR
ncbi:hypothetical protein PIIN_04200 [Serendipita indica DSM 11827]|uniref:F-box domain-containing protein n=1 Tax=Serendipita indica (strain DSM 11827) TaxID=1109443 RepID=G4TG32_SERID|nr:hypothetical protein PIIN_04200 [Serendipita indica DSM 11827]